MLSNDKKKWNIRLVKLNVLRSIGLGLVESRRCLALSGPTRSIQSQPRPRTKTIASRSICQWFFVCIFCHYPVLFVNILGNCKSATLWGPVWFKECTDLPSLLISRTGSQKLCLVISNFQELKLFFTIFFLRTCIFFSRYFNYF